MDPVAPLAADLRELLDGERALTERAPDADRASVMRGLDRELGLVGLAPQSPPGPTAPTSKVEPMSGASGLRAAHVVVASVLSFGAGIGVGAAIVGPRAEPRPASELASAASTAPASPASAAPALSLAVPSTEVGVEASAAPAAASAIRAGRAPLESASGAPPSASETRERTLLDRARTALGRGDVAAASSALDEHAQRYPRGALAEEREFLRIQESLRSGKRDEAAARARAFRTRYPTSVLLPSVDRLLAAPSP